MFSSKLTAEVKGWCVVMEEWGVVTGPRRKLVCHLELEVVDTYPRHLPELPSHLDGPDYSAGGKHVLTHGTQLIVQR